MLDEPNFLQLLLFSAVRENNVDKLRDFMNIDYGGHWYECRTQSGDNPLHLASQLGHMDTVRFLFEVWKPAVSVLEMNNMYGKTCLHDAAQGSHPEVVKYLIERGAVIDALKMGNWTPLILASTKTGENAALNVLELLKSGTNMRLRNKDGWTALHIAVRAGDPSHITLLDYDSNIINLRTVMVKLCCILKCGLSPNFRNSPSGVTLLHRAAHCDRLISVQHPSLTQCNKPKAFNVDFGGNEEEIRRVLKEHSDGNSGT